jgi:hypothetical protein
MIQDVMLNSDSSNYIKPRYTIVETTVGNSLASSFVWLQCVSQGFDTQENYEKFARTFQGYNANLTDGKPIKQTEYTFIHKTGLVGTIGEWKVENLNNIKPYKIDIDIDFMPNFPLG